MCKAIKKVGHVVKSIASNPIVHAVAPLAAGAFFGPVGAGLVGAAEGGLSGGGFKGALLGGATGALAGGGGSFLSGAAGLTGAGAAAGAGALTGASEGLYNGGGAKGALLGGALGGGFGYLQAGGSLPGLGSRAGAPLSNGLAGPTQGSGLIGSLTRDGLGSAGGGSLYSLAGPVLSAGLGTSANNSAQDAIDKSQKKNAALYGQIANEQFTPGDLTKDPGFQFQLDQGQQALDRKAAAGGNFYSGAALKDAQTFSQGLASQTYDDAHSRFIQDQAQKLQGITGIAGTNDTIGSAAAQTKLNNAGLLGQSGSALLGSLGGGNAYDPKTGTYYNPSQNGNASDAAIQALLKKYGIAA